MQYPNPRRIGALAFAILWAILSPQTVGAQIVIRVPLRITIDDRHFDSTRTGMQGHFKFALVDAAGKSLWSQDGASMQGGAPEGFVRLHVTNGVVIVPLGAPSVGMPINGGSLSTDMPPVKLRVWFGTDEGMMAQLTPDFPLSSAPAAVLAQGLPNNSVQSVNLPNGAIISAKLANGAVGGFKLAPGAVGTMHLMNDAVTSEKIADGAISSSIFQTNSLATIRFMDNSIGTTALPDDAVIERKLATGAAAGAKFANAAVTETKLLNGAVTSIKIGNQQVAGNHFAGHIVGTDKFADGGVAGTDLADSSVTAPKLAGAITSTAVANNAVTPAKLGANALVSALSDGDEDGLLLRNTGVATFTNSLGEGWLKLFSKPAYGNAPYVSDLKTNNVSLDGQDRFSPSQLWNGQQWFVWGVHSSQSKGLRLSGTRFSVFGNQFSVVPLANSPIDRTDNELLWTGQYYIVWGGQDSPTNKFNDGGFFNPNSQKWTPMNASGAPAARSRPASFAQRGRMGVWGGGQDRDLYWFDPGVGVNGAWSKTTFSDPDLPSARTLQADVWTGDRLIVWGGLDDNTFSALNNGAILNPTNSTNPWRALPATDAPTARFGARSVWTGAEMIIWGGIDSMQNGLNTGARYHIVQDKWTPLPTTNAPQYRTGSQVIWTGLDMLVLAPQPNGNSTTNNRIYRYNLAQDRWTQDTTFANSNVSPFQSTTTFAWIGDRLIIYTGNNSADANFDAVLPDAPVTSYFFRP